MQFTIPILGAILAFSTHAAATGINCQGSSKCGQLGSSSLQGVIDAAKNAGDFYKFQNGEHVACVQGRGSAGGSLCAFPQGTNGGIEGWKAKQLLGFLKDHGCGKCGSVPRDYPVDNDVKSTGMLTVNWVK
jgi:hypothetical protein